MRRVCILRFQNCHSDHTAMHFPTAWIYKNLSDHVDGKVLKFHESLVSRLFRLISYLTAWMKQLMWSCVLSEVTAFKSWMVQHKKSYANIEEEEQRLMNFVQNYQAAKEHNGQSHSWKSMSSNRILIIESLYSYLLLAINKTSNICCGFQRNWMLFRTWVSKNFRGFIWCNHKTAAQRTETGISSPGKHLQSTRTGERRVNL